MDKKMTLDEWNAYLDHYIEQEQKHVGDETPVFNVYQQDGRPMVPGGYDGGIFTVNAPLTVSGVMSTPLATPIRCTRIRIMPSKHATAGLSHRHFMKCVWSRPTKCGTSPKFQE